MSELQHPLKGRGKAAVTDLLAAKPLPCSVAHMAPAPPAAWPGSQSPLPGTAIFQGGVLLAQAINTESY